MPAFKSNPDESIWAIFYPTVARAISLHEDLFKATRKPDDFPLAQAMAGDEFWFSHLDKIVDTITEAQDLALNMVSVFKEIKQECEQHQYYHNKMYTRYQRRAAQFYGRSHSRIQCKKLKNEHKAKAMLQGKMITALEACEKQLMDRIYEQL
ncbi:hypothetical protein PMZ80_009557 [Knufia obscura]|uniref:Uncharacterized protein n=1 Tax=Knufia obscura TaxID=1635080 RepID=A0ABR0RCK0_9EURO|nr:hypothetical protein PMZ80_009557 [Knufia obscura]